MRTIARLFAACLLAAESAGLAGPASATEEAVVLTSTVDKVKVGAKLALDATVDLPAGAAVTLIRADGGVIKLSGPYSGPVAGKASAGASDPKLVETLANLLESGEDANKLGANRGVFSETEERAASAAISGESRYCVGPNQRGLLWRDRTARGQRVVLRAADGKEAKVEFGRGEKSQPWPEVLKHEHNSVFAVMLRDRELGKITVHHHEPTGPTVAHKAASLARAGCTDQARALLETLE